MGSTNSYIFCSLIYPKCMLSIQYVLKKTFVEQMKNLHLMLLLMKAFPEVDFTMKNLENILRDSVRFIVEGQFLYYM